MAAYWSTGAEHFFEGIGTSLSKEISRYDYVIYLESADEQAYLHNKSKNPNRTEDWAFAKNLDIATREIWSQHPNFSVIQNHHSFDTKIIKAINLVEAILKKQTKLKLVA